ncbi:hypothetical protein JCM30471_35700 [Desulfuromonas carbonis]|uniref:rod shape-determining protein MreD n=1 Tax=Desulfuromonas sp. DDH964 TaxID=1823759 RepID=UPI00078C3BAE|nr:rod shape-determining protein MreD [Desulfuromonas sp. DDH964]AMV72932.1 cell shape-determining protein MreD [Desulfuromonas sp. DDH964]
MTRVSAYFLLGYLFILLQAGLLPRMIPLGFAPDLLLILIVYLGLNEDYLRGSFLAYLLGCFLDVFAGSSLGLYGMALLAVFLTVRGAVGRFNAENSLLLLFMVGCGTLLEGAVIIGLGFLADIDQLWVVILPRLSLQMLLNLCFAWLLLKLVTGLQRRLLPRRGIPGLQRLDSRYES